jgi:trehalose 6-phosphate phosphatase
MAHISKEEDLIPCLEKEIKTIRPRRLLVAMDYDGTLVPFAPRPEQAVPSLRVRRVLDRLAGRSDMVTAIVSGRTMEELESFFPRRQVWLSGLHGAVVSAPGKKPEWLIDPERIRLLQDRIRHFSRRLNDLPEGFRMEDKGLSLAIHFRGVPQESAREGLGRLVPFIDALLDRSLFQLLYGAQVVEIRPLNADKGKAVGFIAEANRGCFPVYLGDDATDEDVFKTLGKKGFTVRISGESGPTAARWRLSTPDDALDFLENLPGVMDRIRASENQGWTCAEKSRSV